MKATRAERVAQITALRAEGLTHREIGARLGISRSTVNNYIIDPTGAKDRARKESYGGSCVSCGARTSGADGRDKAPEHCLSCAQGRPPDARRTTFVLLRALHLDVRVSAAFDWIRTHPSESELEKIELALVANAPGNRGGWIAGEIPAELLTEAA